MLERLLFGSQLSLIGRQRLHSAVTVGTNVLCTDKAEATSIVNAQTTNIRGPQGHFTRSFHLAGTGGSRMSSSRDCKPSGGEKKREQQSNEKGAGETLKNTVEKYIKNNGVVLFSKTWCPFCLKAKDLLKNRGIDPVVWELDTDANGESVQASLLELTGQGTVPNIFINQKHVGGYSDLYSLDEAGALRDLVDSIQLKPEDRVQKSPKQQVDDFITSNNIAIFSKSWCPYCTKAKSLLDGFNVEYGVLELDLAENGELIQANLLVLTGQKTVPNIFINHKHIGGYSDLSSLNENGALEGLIKSAHASSTENERRLVSPKQLVDDFIASNSVALFSKSWCPYCTKAKSLLDGFNVKYGVLELDLEDNGELIQANLLELTGQKTVPNIFINHKHVGGYSDLSCLNENGALEGLISSAQASSTENESRPISPKQLVDDFIASNFIALFSKSWCPYCAKAKSLFDRCNVKYGVLELDLREDGEAIQEALHNSTGQKTVPNIFINTAHIGGFSDLSKLDASGGLSGLLTKENKEPIQLSYKGGDSYEASILKAINESQVVIFSKTWCPWCTKAKASLTSQGVTFQVWELDLDANGVPIQAQLHELSGQKTVPNIYVNGQHIGGYSDLAFYESAGLLDDLLAKKNLDFDFDLIVIGGGSGGISAAKEAAAAKKKVALCDFVTPSPRGTIWGLGGTCVNVGCIPKKLMHRAAIIRQDIKDSIDFGWKLPVDISGLSHCWKTMVDNIQSYISSLNDGYLQQLKDNNVTYFNANASFIDKHTVQITSSDGSSKQITAKNILVAVGGRPAHLDIPNAKELCITSDDIFTLATPPGKTLVIGASYIALECAGFLAGLGYHVSVMVRSILLRGFDQECAGKIEKCMEAHRITFLKKCVPTSIERIQEDGHTKLAVKGEYDGGEQFEGHYDTVLVAVGRTALTENLQLPGVGVQTNPRNKKIVVNDHHQSSVKNIFAVGDVIERPELTPVAIQAGKLLAKHLYSGSADLMDYANVPTTVFTPLEYGCVGLSEEEAIAAHGLDNLEIYHSSFTPLEHALRSWGSPENNDGFAKLICLKENKEQYVIGLHILSPNAGEITQGLALGVRMRATKSQFDSLVGIHPTIAEVFTTLKVTKASGEDSAAKGC